MENEKKREKDKYFCKYCNFKCMYNSDWERHKSTYKHIKKVKIMKQNICDNDIANEIIQCNICFLKYKTLSGLWKHKQTCKPIIKEEKEEKEESNDNTNKIILKIFEENSNLINKLANDNTELHNIIKEIVKSGIMTNSHNTNNSHNNTNNNTFNLQLYLNETCKNAMNLSEFIETIKPTLEELELTGRVGYAKGISHIFTSRLDEVNKEEKPIQCTDGKREVLYIKENNIWNKEDEEKTLLKKAIKMITHKNLCNISEWQKMYPDCTNSESRKNDTYLKIIFNSMPGETDEETVSNYEKIMSLVAKNTTIDK